jgi:hypothetical protein
VWDTTSTNWSQSSDGTTGPYVLWNSAANDTAIFGGTAGAVTIGGAVSTRFLTFQTDGYSLSNGTLTFTGTAPAITINGADTRVSISSTIIGNAIISDPETSDALIIRGGGTLVLTGNTTTNGLARIAGAHVRLEGGGANHCHQHTSRHCSERTPRFLLPHGDRAWIGADNGGPAAWLDQSRR